jgi:S-adenosylmethionine hydrolase
MSKSNNSFIKKQKELVRKKKREEKEEKKIERKKNATGGDLESMMAYVDEFGNITSTPPEKK